MKEVIPKWRLEKVVITRNGIVDLDFSGFELQKNGIQICKFGLDSLKELKEFFANLDLSTIPRDNN